MEVIEVKDRGQQRQFLDFRRKLYKESSLYVDNNLFLIQELFAGKTSFVNDTDIYAFNVKDSNNIVCQGLVVYASDLSDYIQLCFFESLEGQDEAAKLLVDKAIEIGKKHNCKKLVIGLNGHVNYGLGLLCDHYDEKNTFSSAANPKFYNDYFDKMDLEKVYLCTYRSVTDHTRIERYASLLRKIKKNYEFRSFDKKRFDEYSKIYTDLNNQAFEGHRYYYKRNYKEDKEMLKELFLFMKEDSLVFAFKDGEPVGFVMWYPDYNELAKGGEVFGAKHFFRNIFMGRKIKYGKLMEYGVLPRHRKSGLVMGLLDQVYIAMQGHGIQNLVSSWILEENADSNSVCQALCDEKYKRYVVYEKEI